MLKIAVFVIIMRATTLNVTHHCDCFNVRPSTFSNEIFMYINLLAMCYSKNPLHKFYISCLAKAIIVSISIIEELTISEYQSCLYLDLPAWIVSVEFLEECFGEP